MKEKEILPEGFKRCSKCGEIKGVGEYHKDGSKKCGVTSYCKICAIANIKIYRDNNKEKVSYKAMAYRKKNKEKISDSAKEYHKQNKEKLSEYSHNWYKDNKEKVLKRTNHYYNNNKELIRTYKKEYSTRLPLALIKQILKDRGFSEYAITPDLIACKRKILQVQRLHKKPIKTKQNEEC